MLGEIWRRIANLFRRGKFDRELSEEMRLHRELRERELGEGAGANSGVTEDEARYEAQRRFGNELKLREESRDMWGKNWIGDFFQDVRYGGRMLRKNPSFTAVAVLTLALGIGANTAIFSVVNAVLLKPLAMEDPSRIVYMQEEWQGLYPGMSVGNFTDVHQQSTSFEKLSSSNNASFNLATQDVPVRVQGEVVTAEYFPTFGVQPIAGRFFTAEEDKPGTAKVVVISERLWRTRLHADPAIVGQLLRVNSTQTVVVGVMPQSFDPLLLKSDVWVPAAFTAQQVADHDDHYLNVMGRLKPGVTMAQAQSELDVIATREQQLYPIDDKGRGFHLTQLTTTLLGDQSRVLWLMLAAVGFVLLIACANIANLQLVRARRRQKEIAVRVALGASPQRVVRQLIAESLVLGFGSGIVGVMLAFWGVSWIVADGPAGVPRLDQANVDASTLGFACGITLLCSFLFGLAPAFRSASTRLTEAFKEGIGNSSGNRDRVRSALVVAEIALALVLMAGAGLLLRSALLVSQVNPGFDASNLTVGRIGLPDASFHDPAVARQAFERILTAAAALPGVQSAAVVSRAPLAGGGGSNGLLAEGKQVDPSNFINANLRIVSSGYLSTVRIPLKAGREFTEEDKREGKMVTIINETLARTMWPGENPIGKRFACCESGPKGRMDPVWHEVVGVVGDVRAWGLDRQVQPEFYLPINQMPPSSWDWIGRTMDVVVRTPGGAIPANELRMAVASIAPGVPIYRLSTMREKISGTLEQSHFDTFLLAVFAATALLLSSIGIYGVLSYMVAQRTREIGIRVALGAMPADVMRDVLWDGARLTGGGLILGLAGAFVGTRLLSSMLYGIGSTDAITFAAVAVTLTVVALLASYLPARRATKVDPIIALRYE
ncbi:MAG TPA: ABC transporter permease [Candidatus Acidoferrum sp.]|nr:ABC transporter permease [Candidatus Acidoferrum sp.]